MKVINGTNVLADGSINLNNTNRFIALGEFERSYSHFAVETGDVLVVSSGSIGKVGRVRYEHLPLMMNTSVIRFQPRRREMLDAAYLYAFLRSPMFLSQVHALAIGAAQLNFGPAHIKLMTIPLPSLTTQKQIAAILSAYDDLIENNTRRIQILEEMAQAIYREWFVEFRFPGHEGVQMVDSEVGPIQEGWEVQPLGQLCLRVIDGDWIETKDQGGDAYRLLQVSNIGIGAFRETGNYRYISQKVFDRLGCNEVRPGSILVSRMPDPVGRAWFVDDLDRPAITAVDVAIVEPDPARIDGRYCAFYLNTPRNLAYAAARASGTTRLRITRRDLATFPIPFPPVDVRHAFGEVLSQHGELSVLLNRSNRALRATRDVLLPRLISGEIDVSNLDIGNAEPAA